MIANNHKNTLFSNSIQTGNGGDYPELAAYRELHAFFLILLLVIFQTPLQSSLPGNPLFMNLHGLKGMQLVDVIPLSAVVSFVLALIANHEIGRFHHRFLHLGAQMFHVAPFWLAYLALIISHRKLADEPYIQAFVLVAFTAWSFSIFKAFPRVIRLDQ